MATSSYRTLDVTLISAQDLKDVNLLSRLEVYAAAALSNDPRTRQRIETDCTRGRNPTWNSTLRFSVPSNAAELGVSLVITLHADRALGDRLVGEVRIPIKELLADSTSTEKVSYQVRRPSGSAKGVLNLSYKFSDTVSYPAAAAASSTYPSQTKLDAPADEPVTAHPVYPPYPTTGSFFPPPATASTHQPPPAPADAAYPPQVVKPPRGNGLRLGLGARLFGGVLGGLLIGDAIGDAVSYDAGYSAGFGDAGFDFGGF